MSKIEAELQAELQLYKKRTEELEKKLQTLTANHSTDESSPNNQKIDTSSATNLPPGVLHVRKTDDLYVERINHQLEISFHLESSNVRGKSIDVVFSNEIADQIRNFIEVQSQKNPDDWEEATVSSNVRGTSKIQVIKMITYKDNVFIFQIRESRDIILAENKIEYYIDISPDLICVADIVKAKYIEVNKAFTEILGYSEKELLSKPFTSFIHPDDIPKTNVELEERVGKCDPKQEFENRYFTKDGKIVWINWKSIYYRESGVAFGIGRDVTEVKRKEEISKAREKLLRALNGSTQKLFKSQTEILWNDVAKIAGHALNPSRLYIMLRDEQSFVNNEVTVSQIAEWCNKGITPQQGHPHLQNIRLFDGFPAMEKHCLKNQPYFFRPADAPSELRQDLERQEIKSLLIVPIIIRDTIYGIVGVDNCETDEEWDEFEMEFIKALANNLSRALERRINHQNILTRNVQLNRFLLYAPAAVAMLDKEMRYLFHSARWVSDYALSESDLRGKKHHEVLKNIPPHWHQIYERCLQGEELSARLDHYIREDGSIRYIRWEVHPWRNSKNEVCGLIISSEDLTSQKNSDDHRRSLEKKIQESQKVESLGVMAGGVAHDFNNLLTGIMSYVDLAKDELDNAESLSYYLDNIANTSQMAADFCEQLLAFSGKGHFVMKNISMNKLIKDVVPLIRRNLSSKVDLTLALNADHSVIHADPTQIRQVIINLILNASDAIESGKGDISISTFVMNMAELNTNSLIIKESTSKGKCLAVEIRDDGCGMDEETQRSEERRVGK